MRQKLENAGKALAVILMVIGLVWILWEQIDKAVTRREPAMAYTYEFMDWSSAETVIFNDLHAQDLLTFHIEYRAGEIGVWVENLKGERVSNVFKNGKAELTIDDEGAYALRIVGNRADATVFVALYTTQWD